MICGHFTEKPFILEGLSYKHSHSGLWGNAQAFWLEWMQLRIQHPLHLILDTLEPESQIHRLVGVGRDF